MNQLDRYIKNAPWIYTALGIVFVLLMAAFPFFQLFLNVPTQVGFILYYALYAFFAAGFLSGLVHIISRRGKPKLFHEMLYTYYSICIAAAFFLMMGIIYFSAMNRLRLEAQINLRVLL